MKSWNKKYRLMCAGFSAIVLCAAAGVLYNTNILKSSHYVFSPDAREGNYVMPEAAYRELMEAAEAEIGYFHIQINASPEVQGKRCNLMIGNPADNESGTFVRLILDDTGEEIYCSEIMQPGERKAYIVLERPPEPGEYAATAVFCMVNESEELIGEVEAGVRLTVK